MVTDNIIMSATQYRVVIQSMFHAFDDHWPSDDEIASWVDSLASIVDAGGSIQAMQVYTVACTPADASVTPLSPERLRWIAEQAQEKGLNARVY